MLIDSHIISQLQLPSMQLYLYLHPYLCLSLGVSVSLAVSISVSVMYLYLYLQLQLHLYLYQACTSGEWGQISSHDKPKKRLDQTPGPGQTASCHFWPLVAGHLVRLSAWLAANPYLIVRLSFASLSLFFSEMNHSLQVTRGLLPKNGHKTNATASGFWVVSRGKHTHTSKGYLQLLNCQLPIRVHTHSHLYRVSLPTHNEYTSLKYTLSG